MTDPEILDDLDRWYETRLRQVILDAATRYEIVGMANDEAMQRLVPPIVMLLVTALSPTKVTPNEAGAMLAETIEIYRQRKRARQQ